MDRIERAVVRECFRETHKILGLPNQDAAAAALMIKNPRIHKDAADKYVKGQPTGALDAISNAALDVLADHYHTIINFYKNNKAVSRYLISLFLESRGAGTRENADIIFDNWRHPYKRGADAFNSGIYQIYRRYKYETQSESIKQSDPNQHIAICELLFADADSMECFIITCQGNIYRGTLYINDDDILYGVVQRRTNDKNGYHQRMFCLKREVYLPMYSAMMIKTGDTTGRPLASECIYIGVPRDVHNELYDAVDELKIKDWSTTKVPDGSMVWDYISSLPPKKPPSHEDWNRVKYVKDFPALAFMAAEHGSDKALFREPLRTLSRGTIGRVCREVELGVFRHSAFADASTSIPLGSIVPGGRRPARKKATAVG